MHRENQKRVKELEKEKHKGLQKKQKVISEYKKSWHQESLTRQIQNEIQNELKQAIRDGKDLETYEFDQEKFKKLEECKQIDDETEVETEDAISIAYDLSEYGDNMVDRLVHEDNFKRKTINENELKKQLEAIFEENEDAEGDEECGKYLDVKKSKNVNTFITQAQLSAYQNLLDKINREKDGENEKHIADDASSCLYTTASTLSKNNHSNYSLRKVKDYLQKKAKEAKKVELEKQRLEEQQAIKKIMDESKISKSKMTSIFNPTLKVVVNDDGK